MEVPVESDASTRPSTYTDAQRRYYERHKDEILARYKERKPWLSYYQRHKEEVKAKVMARYRAKKAGTQVPVTSSAETPLT